ncbi:response regulator transcription factor [Aestuariibacter salexigens]|uniref:response regulator transcription factor n=1 Tax=Aestuariibacter salexigens TaxID=226010 RepID=UPI0004053079|nr:response regulator transcription factor [Aestuariibacter salexigens]
MKKILIADDHPLFREALIAALPPVVGPVNMLEADSLDTLLAVIEKNRDIDLVLLDLQMPGCDHFYGLIRLASDYPQLPVAVISANEDLTVIAQVMRFGARAFIPKSTRTVDIGAAINQVLAGNSWLPADIETKLDSVDDNALNAAEKLRELTPKQFEVLKKLQHGLMNKQIADDMHVTEATIKAHISAIFKKLNVNSRTQAVLLVENLNLD